MSKFEGCYTALITPLQQGEIVDYESLANLVEFQIENGISGILSSGTTGESATLTREEQQRVNQKVFEILGKSGTTICGTGSNKTKEALLQTNFVYDIGVRSILLVDPYYNGPSSLEIRREYLSPIAEAFPEIEIIPYIIPSRCGTQLLPQDLAILSSEFENIRTVKEATGNFENMKTIRALCGSSFTILSGDDAKTNELISSPSIRGSGVISVASNIVPKAVQEFVQALLCGSSKRANELAIALEPLFDIITVTTEVQTHYGSLPCRSRNPVPYKMLMNILGMNVGLCRQPLGKMTKEGINVLLNTVRSIYTNHPELLIPIEQFFDVDLSKRLYESRFWEELVYA